MNKRKFLDSDTFNFLSEQAKLKEIIKLGSYAASSHNTQPWLFKINDKTIEILPNMKRSLPKSDPENRELYLSLGAAFENILWAAKGYGLQFESKLENLVHSNSVASISFSSLEAKEAGPELEVITKRHANRYPFEDKKIPSEFIERIKKISTPEISINIINNEADMKRASAIVENATKEAFEDKNFTSELSEWMKPSLKKHKDGMPGYNIDIPWPISFIVPLAIRYLDLSKAQVDMVKPMLNTSPLFVIITTKENNEESWVKTGQIFERISLEAQEGGIKTGMFGAPIEIGDNYKELQKIINSNDRPQMFFRLGYAEKTPVFSPRLDVEEIVIK